MSDDTIKADVPQVPEPVPEPAPEPAPVAAMETTPPTDSVASEDKPTPLPTVVDEDKPTPLPTVVDKEKLEKPSFKKPQDIKKPQLSPEKIEEAKLNAKYGKMKPGGSDFLRKKLNKGVKYFDSGDYNMEKQSGKLKLRPNSGKPHGLAGPGIGLGAAPPGVRLPAQTPLGQATGKTIPTPASIPHRKQSTEISKLAV